MMAELPSFLVDMGALTTILIAILTLSALFSRTRPVRFVWRNLVSDPIGEWQTKRIEAVVEPITARLDETSTALVEHMAEEVRLREADNVERAERQRAMDEWSGGMADSIDGLRIEVVGMHQRVDRTLEAVIAGNPEIRLGFPYDGDDEEGDRA